MATGEFWDDTDPFKPWGWFDPDDIINIPFDFSEYLTSQGSTYVSHTLTPDVNLEATTVAPNAGEIVVQVAKASAGVLKIGTKYGVTCQITASDGQKQSKTLYLKIKEH